MKVIVTGGVGFVGTNLIRRLLNEGHSVISIDNYTTGSSDNHQEGLVTYIMDDIRTFKNWEDYKDVDVVYHMAAIARIQPSFQNPKKYYDVNANGTLHIADFCSRNNIPVVYAGSSSHHSGRFKNPYTFSKDIGEDILKMYEENFDLKFTTARFYNVYGPHHLKTGGYTTLIGRWENYIENNLPLIIYGDGSKRRDFTHVDDIVDGLIKIKTLESWGKTFEFGRGKNYSVDEIAQMFGKEKIYKDDLPGEAQTTLCDYTLAKQILDWEPKKNIEDYIKEFLNKK